MTTAEVLTITRARDRVWAIRVRCPYCQRVHLHGGGKQDNHIDLSPRLAHCGTGDYRLIDTKEQP